MRRQRGYSLIELVIVILIIGVLMAGLAIPLSSKVRTARVQHAQADLERIRDALIGYTIADPNRRLPCPDVDGDGQGDDDTASSPDLCKDVEGDLPWADLGVGRRDPWGEPYRYRADDAYTAATGVPDPPDTSGAIAVLDLADESLTVGDPKGPAAVVFSTGPNLNADDDNGNGDNVFTQDLTNDSFDDILVILSKNVFINRLVQSRKWPP